MKKADPPLHIQIPSAGADQPSWMRVGAIAVIGFAVGIAWPRLAGVRLGPNAPVSSLPANSNASSSAESAPPKPTASGAAPVASASLVAPVPPVVAPAAASAAGVAPAGGGTTVTVGPGILLSCRTEGGETLKGKACGPIPFDTIALPRLRRLSTCAATPGSEGRFSPKFQLDFERNKMSVQLGTKNTVGNVDSLSTCLGALFEKVSINAVAHEHSRYLLQYNIVFAPAQGGSGKPGVVANTPPAPAAAEATGGSKTPSNESGSGGEAKIAWDVAIVRDAPRTGSIVGRIQRGTPVQILATENNWYKVRGGASEGWLYRGAIGR